MKELDVRLALYDFEIERILKCDSDSLVVDELGLFEGAYRIDLAVINSHLHGYEIKSGADNLDRLPAQQDYFSRVFDRITLVAAEKHVSQAVKIVPDWWGLIAVSTTGGKTCLNEIWPSRLNLRVDPYAVCQLLWREEALAALKERQLDRGLRTKPRKRIWQALSSQLSLSELREIVRTKLAGRKGWRKNELLEEVSRRSKLLAEIDAIVLPRLSNNLTNF